MTDRFAWGAGELVPSEEIDDEVAEAATHQQDLNEQISLVEAAGGASPKGRRFRARLIAGDIQGSSGYYPATMLSEHAGVFRQGLPVYLDHPGVTEAYERPERSVRDLAGRLASPAVYERDGLYATVEVYPHWAPVIEAMADDIGMSIRASGTVEASTTESIRGPIVTSLTEASSVDFVTAAGAGGKIVALLESARSEGELLRQAAEALAPPFKKDDPAEDEMPDNADDQNAEDDGEDEDKKPPFLKGKKVAEARNVGNWLESRLHLTFTSLADDMFGEGRITRDERITLSSAIGDALTAFTTRAEADSPRLYDRDLWDEPNIEPDLDDETENTTTKGAPVSGSTEKQTPPDRGTDVTESARVRDLTTQLAEAQQTASKELAELRKRLDESDQAKQALANDKAARTQIAEALKTSNLPVIAHTRVTESVVRDLPTGADGTLDVTALGEAIKTAINDETTYVATLAEAAGAGMPRGLGATGGHELSEADVDKALASVFENIGMNESAAKTAAYGRG